MKAKTPATRQRPVLTSVSQPPMLQPQPTPTPMAPPPASLAQFEERMSADHDLFTALFGIGPSERHRTMSGAPVEAVDEMNAGPSTVLKSTRPGTPHPSPPESPESPNLEQLPPQRDPLQAVYAWRDREEAETRQREKARRPRPGVHFEAYEDHPQAERHKSKYVARSRARIFG